MFAHCLVIKETNGNKDMMNFMDDVYIQWLLNSITISINYPVSNKLVTIRFQIAV